MSEQLANVPLLNLIPLLIVVFAYFFGVAMINYHRGAAKAWWSFVIGAGALFLIYWQGDTIIKVFNYGMRFVGLIVGGGLDGDGGLDALSGGTDLIIQCTGDNAATCNESGFFFLTWLGIVIVGHFIIFIIDCCFVKEFKSQSNGWAFVAGLLNAWLYGFILLPPLCALFGYDLETDPFTDLVDAFWSFLVAVYDLVAAVTRGIAEALSMPPWVVFLIGLILLLIIAVGSISGGKSVTITRTTRTTVTKP